MQCWTRRGRWLVKGPDLTGAGGGAGIGTQTSGSRADLRLPYRQKQASKSRRDYEVPERYTLDKMTQGGVEGSRPCVEREHRCHPGHQESPFEEVIFRLSPTGWGRGGAQWKGPMWVRLGQQGKEQGARVAGTQASPPPPRWCPGSPWRSPSEGLHALPSATPSLLPEPHGTLTSLID